MPAAVVAAAGRVADGPRGVDHADHCEVLVAGDCPAAGLAAADREAAGLREVAAGDAAGEADHDPAAAAGRAAVDRRGRAADPADDHDCGHRAVANPDPMAADDRLAAVDRRVDAADGRAPDDDHHGVTAEGADRAAVDLAACQTRGAEHRVLVDRNRPRWWARVFRSPVRKAPIQRSRPSTEVSRRSPARPHAPTSLLCERALWLLSSPVTWRLTWPRSWQQPS